jgi:hypothetical protein
MITNSNPKPEDQTITRQTNKNGNPAIGLPFLFVIGDSFIPLIGRSWLIDSLLGVRIR